MSRSTSNKYAAGGPSTRRKRHERLVVEFRADVDLAGEPACRCYRCGCLLTVDTVTADRRVPGCEGGDYSDENVRPACGSCNSITGGQLGHARQKAMATS